VAFRSAKIDYTTPGKWAGDPLVHQVQSTYAVAESDNRQRENVSYNVLKKIHVRI